MSDDHQRHLLLAAAALGGLLSIYAALLLVGWRLAIEPLVWLTPGHGLLPPNTTICVGVLGIAVMLRALSFTGPAAAPGSIRLRSAATLLGGAVLGYALLQLFQLSSDGAPAYGSLLQPLDLPGRLDEDLRIAETAIVFCVLVALCFNLQNLRSRFLTQLAATMALIGIALLWLTVDGDFFGTHYFEPEDAIIHSSVLITLLLAVLLSIRSEFAASLLHPSADLASTTAWALPTALLVPLVLEWVIITVWGRPNGATAVGVLTIGVIGTAALLLTLTTAVRAIYRSKQEIYSHHYQFGVALEAVMDGILIIEQGGIISFANSRAEILLGMHEGSLVGTSAMALIPTARPDSHPLLAAVDGGHFPLIASVETMIRRLSGEELPARLGMHSMPTQDTNRMLVAISDLTGVRGAERERRLLIDELRSALDESARGQAYLRAALESLPAGVFLFDHEGRSLFVNGTAAQMFGFDSSEALRRSLSDLSEMFDLINLDGTVVRPEDWPARRLLNGEEFSDLEFAVRRRATGESGRFVFSGRLLSAEFQDLHGLVAVQDVTQERTLEAKLIQAQKMEAVGQLTGGMAHDFNNILTVILGNAELVLSSIDPASTAHADVRELVVAGQRGATLVRQLLQFSRRGILQPEDLDPNMVIGDLHGMLRRLLPETVAMSYQEGRSHGLMIRADRSSLEQMIVNICNNARDAMPHGGSLTLGCVEQQIDESDAMRIPGLTPGRYININISDDGTGIDQETLAQVYEPFFTTKPAAIGTGLGLAMVYGLMKQHGGAVHIETEVGTGTTVNLYFPVIHGSAHLDSDGEGRPLGATAGDGNLILVVEDDPAIRRATRRVLETAGYRVLLAEDGLQALTIFDEHRDEIDMVLSDLVMPNLGGRELGSRLRAKHPDLCILFTSGYAPGSQDFSRTIPEGSWFIHKPWSASDLTSTIREILAARTKH